MALAGGLPIDTLAAFMNQPRFIVERSCVYNGAGEYLEAIAEQLNADLDQLIFRSLKMTEDDLSEIDRDSVNRMLLHYEARCDMPADHIAAVATALAVKGAIARGALRQQGDHGGAA